MIKDILVHVDGSDAAAQRLDLAVNLAALTGAALTGVNVRPPAEIAPLYKPSRIPSAIAFAEEADWRSAQEAERLFSGRMGRNSRAEWRALAGDMAETLAKEARTYDLVIVGQYEWEGPVTHHPLSLAENLVGRCGRPLLVVPAEGKPQIPKTALIAWDGSKEAVRSLHDSIALLCASGASVEIAWFGERQQERDLQRVADHLEHHGVSVSGCLALQTGSPAGRGLIDKVNQGHFDLLIMGAFHHPAWFEFLFGGTTAAAMLSAVVPVFVSH